jgi:hypothetical protein
MKEVAGRLRNERTCVSEYKRECVSEYERESMSVCEYQRKID